VILTVSALNPQQGSILAGLGGLFTIVVPMGMFWVGRAFGDERALVSTLRATALCGLLAAFYGLYQLRVGPPTWDVTWAEAQAARGFVSVAFGGGLARPFGPFSSPSEYGVLVLLGMLALLGATRSRLSLPWMLMIGAIPAYGVWTTGSRGIVVSGVLAAMTLVAVRSGVRPAAAIAIGIVAVVARRANQRSGVRNGSDVL
jgi:hypothetical protein